MIKKLFLFVILFWCSSVNASTYYINYSTGNDTTGDGSSGTPWKTCTPIEGQNFLQPGDTVYLTGSFVGADADCSIYSDGTSASPIIIDGQNTSTFDCSTAQADIPGWDGWIYVDNNVYATKVSLGFTAVNIYNESGTDNYKSLGLDNSLYTATSSFEKGRFSQNATGFARVRTWDNSDPNLATWRFATEQGGGEYRGAIRTGRANEATTYGDYVTFRNIAEKGCAMGFSSQTLGTKFEYCTAEYNGREGFYFIANDVEAPGANNNTCLYCVARYNNARRAGGTGQQYTVESSYVDLKYILSEYGWMAGVDWLDYNDHTHATYGRLLNSNVRYNSLRSLQNTDDGGFDPQVYIDGGSYIVVGNNTIIGNKSNTSFTSQNATPNISNGTEHASDYAKWPNYNTFYNNYSSASNYFVMTSGCLIGSSPCPTDGTYNKIKGLKIYGNTLRSSGAFLLRFQYIDTSDPNAVEFYNNIASYGNSNYAVYWPTGGVRADYNVYNNNDSDKLFFYNGSDFTLAEWQTATGNDLHSYDQDPGFVTCLVAGYTSYGGCLSNTAAGDASNSVAVGTGNVNAANWIYRNNSTGFTQKDGVDDLRSSWDIGVHFDADYGCTFGFSDSASNGCPATSINGATISGFSQ